MPEWIILGLFFSLIFSWAYMADFPPDSPATPTEVIALVLAIPGMFLTVVLLSPVIALQLLGDGLNLLWSKHKQKKARN